MDIKEMMSRLAASNLEFSSKQQAEAIMKWLAKQHGKEVRWSRDFSLGGDGLGEAFFIEHERLVFLVQRTGDARWRMKLLLEAPPTRPVLQDIQGHAASGASTPRLNLEGLMDLQLTPEAMSIPWQTTWSLQLLKELLHLDLQEGSYKDIASRMQQLGQGLGFKVQHLQQEPDFYQALCVCGPGRRSASTCLLLDAHADTSGVFSSVEIESDEKLVEAMCRDLQDAESGERERREIYAAMRQKHNEPAPYSGRQVQP